MPPRLEVRTALAEWVRGIRPRLFTTPESPQCVETLVLPQEVDEARCTKVSRQFWEFT